MKYICFCFLSFFFWSSSVAQALKVVEKGKSNYNIVVDVDASENMVAAASILQRYLRKITDITIPIIDKDSRTVGNKGEKRQIIVGKITAADVTPHQISIRTRNGDLQLLGGSDLAVKYVVYEFLERYLNCRWYSPEVEFVPELKTLALPAIDFHYTPEITKRTVHSRLFYGDSIFADKHKVTHISFPDYVPEARVHTFHKFVPEEKFYKAHPEYFAWRGKKRLPTQLCLTNDKVLEIVKDSVAALFSKNPKSSVISVSQDDNQQYCQCDDCSRIDAEEGSHSGSMIRFVNKVAEAFPNKTISTLAYQHTRRPCKTRPAENVLITLCSIECDRSAPIAEKCVDFAQDLKGWGELTDNLRIWDYTTQFTNFLAPFPNIHTLKPNIGFFKDNGAKWIFEQHSNHPSELFELRSYIMAKLLWNPSMDINYLIKEFTKGYYGDAGKYINGYIDSIHSKLSEDDDFFLFLYGDPSQAFSSYLNMNMLDRYTELFDAAENAVDDSPVLLERVQTARLGVDYAVLEACRKGVSDTYSLTRENDQNERMVNKKTLDVLYRFKKTCNKAGITLMNEMGFTVDEYYDNYKKALEAATRPNKALGKEVVLLTKPKKYAGEDPQVLTDGALGGNGFYANWLGFEGNDMEAVIDLGQMQEINTISSAYLQVTNHVVFFPTEVSYYGSTDNKNFQILGTVHNKKPLTKESKVNDIQYFDLGIETQNFRYLKIRAQNMGAPPYWHHAAGTPSWIFTDEVILN